jgi:hypothetical protein
VVYVFTLAAEERDEIHDKLTINQYFTRVVPGSLDPPIKQPQLALIFVREGINGKEEIKLDWLGVVMQPHGKKAASLGYRVKVDVIRQMPKSVPLPVLAKAVGGKFTPRLHSVLRAFTVPLDEGISSAVVHALRSLDPSIEKLVAWLEKVANADRLESSRQDGLWREERDAARLAIRLAGFPTSALSAWQRPDVANAPYLAGLIPEPTEQSMIEHDARIFDGWGGGQRRCDIHVLVDGQRRLEIANVNATPVEGRLGTDLIYYHEPTHSFILVQYKRLHPRTKSIYVDEQLESQLARLESVAELSRGPREPRDWRLGSDPCFLKLALWQDDDDPLDQGPAPGMYLPVSYVRILLQDHSSRGPKDGRVLGYGNVNRYLANTQFLELVKEGLVGTVGTTVEMLRKLVTARAKEGYGILAAAERGEESSADRQKRIRSRGRSTKRGELKVERAAPSTSTLF